MSCFYVCVRAGEHTVFANRLPACVRVWASPCDHAGEHFEDASLPHLCHGSGGVSVFCWSRVRMGLPCFCPEDGGLLQLSVRQHHWSQRNAGPRSVWYPHPYYLWASWCFNAAKHCFFFKHFPKINSQYLRNEDLFVLTPCLTRFFSTFVSLFVSAFYVSTDCSGQDEQFSLVFTIASFMNNFSSLPNGFLFDRFGTTVARLFGMWVQEKQHP